VQDAADGKTGIFFKCDQKGEEKTSTSSSQPNLKSKAADKVPSSDLKRHVMPPGCAARLGSA
jgi:hypothetical protein